MNKLLSWISLFTIEPLILNVFYSLCAALIFWIVFNYLPTKKRYNKIRPIIEYDIYEFHLHLFFLLDEPLRISKTSTSPIQLEMRYGLLREEDFSCWLQNKCLNETYKYGIFKDDLICIGEELEKFSLDLCDKAKHIFQFSEFITPEEILLIRKILNHIREYTYTGNGNEHRTVNPNISYMATTFYHLYELYIELEQIMSKYKKINHAINYNLSKHHNTDYYKQLYYKKKYLSCLFNLMLNRKKPDYTRSLLICCLYRMGFKKKALVIMEKHLANFDYTLVGHRSSFDDLYLNKDVKDLLIKVRGQDEYDKMIECIDREKHTIACIKKNASIIATHYSNTGQITFR